jgi:hypothetical protein
MGFCSAEADIATLIFELTLIAGNSAEIVDGCDCVHSGWHLQRLDFLAAQKQNFDSSMVFKWESRGRKAVTA